MQIPELSQWLPVTRGHVEAFICMRPARVPLPRAPRPSGMNGKLHKSKRKREDGVMGLRVNQEKGAQTAGMNTP